MFFFALMIFLGCGWFLPWWGLALVSLVLGVASPKQSLLSVGAAAGVAWAALAYIQDGRSHGLISHRMSGLFALPSPALMFLVMAFLGAVTAVLFFATGKSFRSRVD